MEYNNKFDKDLTGVRPSRCTAEALQIIAIYINNASMGKKLN